MRRRVEWMLVCLLLAGCISVRPTGLASTVSSHPIATRYSSIPDPSIPSASLTITPSAALSASQIINNQTTPALPTSTPSERITQGFSAQIGHLPPHEGENTLRAYSFADRQRGWIALGANVLFTRDGGANWIPLVTLDKQVKRMALRTALSGWIETQKEFWVTQDGGATWQKTGEIGRAHV